MRASLACMAFVSATLTASVASAQLIPSSSRTTGASSATAAPNANTPAAAPAPLAPPARTAACTNPDAIGVARTVEIDTTGGPGFGFEHFRQHDFLRTKEVVLTFDDGPWLETTPKVLQALAEQCTKATFFPIGKHATYYPEILKQVAEAGHSIGSHTWSHQDLSKKGMTIDAAKAEIEKGVSAVRIGAGSPTSPFFRFPALRHPPELVTYLGERNIAIFSTDMDSFDFTARKPEQVINKIMTKLEKHGKGIVLMHDFQRNTAEAVAQLLKELKDKGYKIVHMKARDAVKTIPEYDEMLVKEQKLPTVSQRPTASVVRTIDGN